METAFFWIAWGLISFWALKTFYFTYDKDKLQKLRLTALGIDLSVLVLFFLPWSPEQLGKFTGWELIKQGSVFVILLGVLIAGSFTIFLANNKNFLKTGAVFHLAASVLFILTMVYLMPGTYTLTSKIIAPIVASFLLLIGNVVVLLLWQQLQIESKKR